MRCFSLRFSLKDNEDLCNSHAVWMVVGGRGKLIMITKCYDLNHVKDDLILMRLTCFLSIFAFSSTERRNLKERDITTSWGSGKCEQISLTFCRGSFKKVEEFLYIKSFSNVPAHHLLCMHAANCRFESTMPYYGGDCSRGNIFS